MSNTEQLFWLFRCTEYQYAKSFIDNGCIKLSTPKTWIELGKSKGHGRGDSLEGVFAAINYLDFKKSITFQATRNNIICSPGQGIIYFSSKNIQNIPCYCLFGLTNTAFEKRFFQETNAWATTTTITTNYFKDFYRNETRDSILNMPELERPVVVIIQSPDKFFNMLFSYLERIGVNKSEILIQKVTYIDKSNPFIVNDAFPKELFLKHTSFKHQCEFRIIINTKNVEALEYLKLCNNIINIGSLDEFTILHEYYLEDMFIELKNNTLRYVLPVPIETKMDDYPKEYYQALFKASEEYDYEDYTKEYACEQVRDLIQYYRERFKEEIKMSDSFWERNRTSKESTNKT